MRKKPLTQTIIKDSGTNRINLSELFAHNENEIVDKLTHSHSKIVTNARVANDFKTDKPL